MTAATDHALTHSGSVHEQLLKAFENTVSDLSAFFRKTRQEALEHADDINRITQMMNDAESKRQYAQELMSAMVLDIDYDLAHDLSAYTKQDHQKACDKLLSMHRNHLLPQLKVPMSCIGTLQWCLIDTFAVEQYC